MPRNTNGSVHYSDIVNSLDEAIMVVDADLVVLFANLPALHLFGASEEALVGQPVFASQPDEFRAPALIDLVRAVAVRGVTIESYTVDAVLPTLGRRAVDVAARRIKRDGVNTDNTLLILKDMTEITRARERDSSAVEQSQAKMTEIGHRVKNNLASILAMLRLERRAMTDTGGADVIDRIALRVESIASLYELLALDSDTGSVDLLSYVRRICTSIERLTGAEKVGWEIRVTGTAIVVGVDDAVQIGAVLNELVANAAKYAFEPGTDDGRILVDCRLDGSEIVIVVRDNGVGIDPNRSAPKSTGLGMKLVDVYLSAMDGTFQHDSRLSEGTTCTLRLPHAPRDIIDTAAGAPVAEDAAIVRREGALPPEKPRPGSSVTSQSEQAAVASPER